MTEPLLVSLHIPKTAGTTLLRVLVEIYGERLQRAYQPPKAGIARTETDGWPDIENPLCIHGHAVLERFPWVREVPDARFITFLRDPMDGAVSLWRHLERLVPWDPSLPASPRHTVEDFLLNHYNHNRYCKWFQRSGRRIGQFFFVGVVERFGESMSVLSKLCGWPTPVYGHDEAPGQRPQLEMTVIEAFRTQNSDDYTLFRHANALLDGHLRR